MILFLKEFNASKMIEIYPLRMKTILFGIILAEVLFIYILIFKLKILIHKSWIPVLYFLSIIQINLTFNAVLIFTFSVLLFFCLLLKTVTLKTNQDIYFYLSVLCGLLFLLIPQNTGLFILFALTLILFEASNLRIFLILLTGFVLPFVIYSSVCFLTDTPNAMTNLIQNIDILNTLQQNLLMKPSLNYFNITFMLIFGWVLIQVFPFEMKDSVFRKRVFWLLLLLIVCAGCLILLNKGDLTNRLLYLALPVSLLISLTVYYSKHWVTRLLLDVYLMALLVFPFLKQFLF